MRDIEFDYIVVGSGAGGGPLAARLAESDRKFRVLLLEGGGEEEPWNYSVPVFHGKATEDPEMRLDHYVLHYGNLARQARDPKYRVEIKCGHQGVYYPRARTLGGCTAHYAMIIIRPHESDWRTIQDATKDPSWAPHEMNKYFARVERWQYSAPSLSGHGKEGWLPTRFADVLSLSRDAIDHLDPSIAEIAFDAWLANPTTLPIHWWDRPWFLTEGHARAKLDPNDLRVLERHGVGVIAVPMAIDEPGRRGGTRERIRAAAKATGQLEVRTHCQVTKLLFDENDPLRVVGVEYLPGERLYRADRDPSRFGQPTGPAQKVRAKREVILSAGTYITPQLLMLSGIGPPEELGRPEINIPVRVNLPGVGKNLQDRYEVGIVAQARKPFPLLKNATFAGPSPGQNGDEFFVEWHDRGRGLYATNGAVIGFLAQSSVAENDEPDLFIFGVPGSFTGYYTNWSSDAVAAPHDKWTWLLLKAHARFRGQITLKSANPLDPPAVNFNYFERDQNGVLTADAEKDMKAMREGVGIVNRLIEGTKHELMLHPQIMKDVDLKTDQGVVQFVEDRAWGHHASCTCKIGGDNEPDAVLDSSFRVRGVMGLRVVDASVFPKIPGFFVVMPIYMIAEKAADVILADAH
jgi:choline dehydrogenase